MFEFMCLRSSHKNQFYKMLFDIETDALQNSVKELSFTKTDVRLKLCERVKFY